MQGMPQPARYRKTGQEIAVLNRFALAGKLHQNNPALRTPLISLTATIIEKHGVSRYASADDENFLSVISVNSAFSLQLSCQAGNLYDKRSIQEISGV
ncbi:MAG: hypothetical protein OEZ39_13460 [Gammaproteobacteria bacterium]|nr:hypothetical protein [Gammaproteobacteria bacterium]